MIFSSSGDCPLHSWSAEGAPEAEEGNKRQPEKPPKAGFSALLNRTFIFNLVPTITTSILGIIKIYEFFCP